MHSPALGITTGVVITVMAECVTCGAIATTPSRDWDQQLQFLLIERRTPRYVRTKWRCPACGTIWIKTQTKSTGHSSWQRFDMPGSAAA